MALTLSAQQTVGLFHNGEDSYQGYTLFNSGISESTYLIDNCGREVHSWNSQHQPGIAVYLLPNGHLLRTIKVSTTIFNGGGSGGGLEILDWDGNVVWSYNLSDDTIHQHHDVEYLPNGNILVLVWEHHSPTEAEGLGMTGVNQSTGAWGERIIEIKPIGQDDAEIVWEWSVWDHLVQDVDQGLPNFGAISDHPHRLDINVRNTVNGDWLHFNSIDYNPSLDQIMISSRVLSEIWIVDHSSTTEEAASSSGGNSGMGGDIMYRWGNPQSYDKGGPEDKILYGPHDAHWIPFSLPDAGKVLIFNNGSSRPDGSYSSIEMIETPLNSSETYDIDQNGSYGPADIFWHYQAAIPTSFFSSNISGSQQLPNGNVLICQGSKGIFFEVTGAGKEVWRYINPVGQIIHSQGQVPAGNATFRIHRHSPDEGSISEYNLEPGEPIELNPWTSDCAIISESNEIEYEYIEVIPNPFSDYLVLNIDDEPNQSLLIVNLAGKRMYSEEGYTAHNPINTRNWDSGIYFLIIKSRKKTRAIRLVKM